MKRFILEQGPLARRALLMIGVVGVPLLFMRNSLDAINAPKLGLLLMIVPLVAAIRVGELLQGADRQGLTRLLVPAAAIAVPLTISWIFSPYKTWALFGNYSRFGGLISYLVVVAFGVLLADAFAGRARALARAFVGAGAVVGGYALIQFVGLDPFEWTLRGEIVNRLTVSTLGNTNFVGGVLGIMFPLAVGLAAMEREIRRVAIVAAAVILLGLLVTVSQGALAAAVAGAAVTGGFILLPKWPRARVLGTAAAALIALGTLGAVLFTIVGPKPGPLPLTVESRGEWWVIAAKMTADSPIVGRGPDVYALEGTLHRTREEAAGVGGFDFTDQPHNVALWFFACAGALGGAGFIAAVGWGVRKGLELADDQVLPAAFFGSLVAYLVQSLVSIDTVALRTVFWIVLAGLVCTTLPDSIRPKAKVKARSKAKRRPPPGEPAKMLPLVLLAAALGLAGFVWGAGFIRADVQASNGRTAFETGDPAGARDAFEAANGFRFEAQYRRLYGTYLGEAAVSLAGSEDPSLRSQAPLYYADARRVFSYLDHVPHANALVDYARFLGRWAEIDATVRDDVVAVYRRALALDPQNPPLASELAGAEDAARASEGEN